MDATDVLEVVGQRVRPEGWNGSGRCANWRSDPGCRCASSCRSNRARGNISVKRLAELAEPSTRARRLLDTRVRDAPRVVALLGLRGAGKTTIGKQLARRLRARFVELDRRIEKAAEMSMARLFSLYGEDHYRRLERETLTEVLAEKRPTVLATGGGSSPLRHLCAAGQVGDHGVAARRPEDHWNRVVSQGIGADGGPSAGDGGSAYAAFQARAALCEGELHDRDVRPLGVRNRRRDPVERVHHVDRSLPPRGGCSLFSQGDQRIDPRGRRAGR
jgi:XRE family aerobic/anaerobic benzoate catabolism transcriptional regulator